MADRHYPMSNIHFNASTDAFDPGDTDILLGNGDISHSRPRWYKPYATKRRYLYVAAGLLVLLILLSATYMTGAHMADRRTTLGLVQEQRIVDRLSAVNGPPTLKFRDNLKPNLKYITSWIDAGWTNDVITYMNILYLATITRRIPIIGVFTPTHVGYYSETIDFGKVFDVPRLSKAIGLPVLEWHEVKDRNSSEVDVLGCWDVWETVQNETHEARFSRLPGKLKLDVSYTIAPPWVKMLPNFKHDRHANIFSLASLGFPEIRMESLERPVTHESKIHRVRLPPDEQLLCFDYLYYTAAALPFEFQYDFSPEWAVVGQHMHWNPDLETLANQYVRKAMGLGRFERIPLYISIHARHADFKTFCNHLPLDQCFASPAVIERRIEEVRQELRDRRGLEVQHVIMTSDEQNSTWWDDVRKQGWFTLDHSRTVELHGIWYPVLIDAVVQSNGVGFVGTHGSTMSAMARRRVLSWHDGAAQNVKWGKPHSDDHRRRYV
ncbi:hypothetical protein APHAL10511_007878 [Amanita phalloides]|nr:hypothetical protein APHAL10511_007878 [Amanita phalloides]